MNKKIITFCISILLLNLIFIVTIGFLINNHLEKTKSELKEIIKSEVEKETLKNEKQRTKKAKDLLHPLYNDMGLKYNKNPQTFEETLLPFINIFTNINPPIEDDSNKSTTN